jgi:Arc/MetJ-type ribon-helix-helix transcriptional regulator
VFGAAGDAAKFVQAPDAEAAIGALGLAREQLGRLIDSARGGGRFVIFVDDLERCQPPRAVEVCEVASQLLAHRGVVTVLMADMKVIAASAEMKYRDVADEKTGRVGREYLEKLVQLQLALPPAWPADMTALLKGDTPLTRTTVQDRAAPQSDAVPWWVLPVAFGVPAAAIALGVGVAIGSTILSAIAGAVLLAALVVRVGAEAIDRRRVQRRMDLQREIDEEIQNITGATNALSEIEAQVLKDGKFEKASDLVRKQVNSYLTEQSDEVRQVEAVIAEYPPELPRSAKRMLNHARLLTRIARDRGLFVGDLTPEHLGKWIVLNERWASVAEAVTRDDELMARLEAAAAHEGGLHGADAKHLGIAGDAAWSQIKPLLASDPPLRDVVQRLVRLDPRTAHPDAEPVSGPSYAAHEP